MSLFAADPATQDQLNRIEALLGEVLARLPNRKPKEKAVRANWAGRIRELWKLHSGELPMGAIRDLTPVVRDIGIDETAIRLTNYLAHTEPQFYSIRRFAATHAQWVPKTAQRPYTDMDQHEAMMRGEL